MQQMLMILSNVSVQMLMKRWGSKRDDRCVTKLTYVPTITVIILSTCHVLGQHGQSICWSRLGFWELCYH